MMSTTLERHALCAGLWAISGGMLWIESTRSLVAADVHLGYEEVIGGALPLWSTQPATKTLCDAAQALQAHEIVLLGDVIHGAHMSAGAARRIGTALETLRKCARLELIAGNHEGRSRGEAVLGATHDVLERAGWTLLHGDRATLTDAAVIGHLHPSVHLGGKESAPVFLGSRRLIVLPALTPYSSGLDVRRDDCLDALAAWNVRPKDVDVVATLPSALFPLGKLSALRADAAAVTRYAARGYRRKFLRPDH